MRTQWNSRVAELMAAVARVEESVGRLDDKIEELKTVSVKRLNNHTIRVDSLEQTRDRQRGAAKLLAGIMVIASSLVAYLAFLT